jgi:hypothetical protein
MKKWRLAFGSSPKTLECVSNKKSSLWDFQSKATIILLCKSICYLGINFSLARDCIHMRSKSLSSPKVEPIESTVHYVWNSLDLYSLETTNSLL